MNLFIMYPSVHQMVVEAVARVKIKIPSAGSSSTATRPRLPRLTRKRSNTAYSSWCAFGNSYNFAHSWTTALWPWVVKGKAPNDGLNIVQGKLWRNPCLSKVLSGYSRSAQGMNVTDILSAQSTSVLVRIRTRILIYLSHGKDIRNLITNDKVIIK